MGELKRFEITVECTSIEGTQTFACFAESSLEARLKFKDNACEIIDEQLEVVGLDNSILSIEESDDISSRLPQDVMSLMKEEIDTLTEQVKQLSKENRKLRGVIKGLRPASNIDGGQARFYFDEKYKHILGEEK